MSNYKPALRIAALALLLVLSFQQDARADGTQSGTSVSNSATVSYSVGATPQDDVNSAPVTFLVDRKIDMTVVTTDVAAVGVTPGTSTSALTFTVTNDGNDTMDYALSATALSGGTGAFGGTDNVDAGSVALFVEDGGNVGYQLAEDTETFVDELAIDASATVYIVGTFGTAGFSDADIASYHLLVEAREGGGATALGAALTETAGADDSAVEDTVFADGQGTDTGNDANRDAKLSDQSDFEIETASLTVTKTSTVISDPVNGGTNPKAIKGAVIEYTVTIANAAGSSTATGISVADDLDTEITAGTIAFSADAYASGKGIRVQSPNLYAGAETDLTNAADGDEGDFTTNQVTVDTISLAAGESATVKFRVVVQ